MSAPVLRAPVLRATGLAVALGGARVLGPLDLVLEPGEHVLLVGPSGSGKTTLLRAIAGLVAPSAGELELFGRRASAPGRVLVRPERRDVGLVFQGGALWPHLSVADTLLFVLRARRIPRGARRKRVAELLDWVELAGFEERLPGTLSGGEAQRLALARTLAADPRLVLLDEPLGPLDAELRAALLRRIGELHRRLAWTTLHVTHDPGEALPLATRVLRLVEGRFAQVEPA